MTTQQNTAKTKRGDLTSDEREMLQVAAAGISQDTYTNIHCPSFH